MEEAEPANLIKELQEEINGSLLELETILSDNQTKSKDLDNEIKKKAMECFNLLFSNQIKLIKQNKSLERNLASKSTELKDKQKSILSRLKEIEQRITDSSYPTESQIAEITNEAKRIKSKIDNIRKESKTIIYDYCFKSNEKLEDLIYIGELLRYENDSAELISNYDEQSIIDCQPFMLLNETNEPITSISPKESSLPNENTINSQNSPSKRSRKNNIEKKLITTEYASESSDYECYFSDVSLEYLTDSGHDFDPDEVTFESKRFNPYDYTKINLETLELNFLKDQSEWQKMKLGFLYKSDMTLSQQNELNQLNNFIFDYILDTFGHKTVTNKTFKTNYGFRILRSCHNRKKKCRAKWTVKINIGQYEAQLNSQNKCDHLIGLNQSIHDSFEQSTSEKITSMNEDVMYIGEILGDEEENSVEIINNQNYDEPLHDHNEPCTSSSLGGSTLSFSNKISIGSPNQTAYTTSQQCKKYPDLHLIKIFEQNLPLNIDIWNSITLKSNSYNSKTLFLKESLDELEKIENYCLQSVRSLGFDAKLCRWRKTLYGYSFYTQCNATKNSNCKSKWIIKIDIKTNKTEIYFNKKCEHVNIV